VGARKSLICYNAVVRREDAEKRKREKIINTEYEKLLFVIK